MKALRRLGRKVKKGFKKIMGSKVGRIAGFIGLAMVMGAAAKALMAGMEGAAVAGAAVGETVGGAVIGETVGASLLEGTVATEAVSAPLIKEITISATKKNTLAAIAEAPTNIEAATEAFRAMEANTIATVDGVNFVNPDATMVHNNITSAVEHQVNTTFNPDATQRFTGYGPDTEFYSGGQQEFLSRTGDITTKDISSIEMPEYVGTPDVAPSTIFDKEIITAEAMPPIDPNSLLVDRGGFDIPMPDVSSVETYEPFRDKFTREFKEGLEWKGPGDAVAGVTKGIAESELMSMIAGEPKEPFYSKGVSPKLESIAPQDAYMSAISPSFQTAMNTDVKPTFEQFSKANLFGTGSKQWLDMFGQQPLMFPSMLGLPQTSGGGSFGYG